MGLETMPLIATNYTRKGDKREPILCVGINFAGCKRFTLDFP